jgi:dihydroorotate dehydrogenase electron transfer subunit
MGLGSGTSLAKVEAQSEDTSAPKPHVLTASRRLGRVVGRDELGGMTRLSLHVPGWTEARPGQFALLQAEGSHCFLARALSICSQSGETVSFLVAPIGEGTRELCVLTGDSAVWVLGPLGNGFDLESLTSGPGRTVLVGGGVGIAPFPLLVAKLAEQAEGAGRARGESQANLLVLAGFRDSEQAIGGEVLAESVITASARGVVCAYERVLEDGSDGPAERVTELLARHLRPGDRVAVCGPEAMSKAVWQICSSVRDVRVWYSLETNMACGVGSCHGCVIVLADGSYARVCSEGPVFAGAEVFGA